MGRVTTLRSNNPVMNMTPVFAIKSLQVLMLVSLLLVCICYTTVCVLCNPDNDIYVYTMTRDARVAKDNDLTSECIFHTANKNIAYYFRSLLVEVTHYESKYNRKRPFVNNIGKCYRYTMNRWYSTNSKMLWITGNLTQHSHHEYGYNMMAIALTKAINEPIELIMECNSNNIFEEVNVTPFEMYICYVLKYVCIYLFSYWLPCGHSLHQDRELLITPCVATKDVNIVLRIATHYYPSRVNNHNTDPDDFNSYAICNQHPSYSILMMIGQYDDLILLRWQTVGAPPLSWSNSSMTVYSLYNIGINGNPQRGHRPHRDCKHDKSSVEWSNSYYEISVLCCNSVCNISDRQKTVHKGC